MHCNYSFRFWHGRLRYTQRNQLLLWRILFMYPLNISEVNKKTGAMKTPAGIFGKYSNTEEQQRDNNNKKKTREFHVGLHLRRGSLLAPGLFFQPVTQRGMRYPRVGDVTAAKHPNASRKTPLNRNCHYHLIFNKYMYVYYVYVCVRMYSLRGSVCLLLVSIYTAWHPSGTLRYRTERKRDKTKEFK